MYKRLHQGHSTPTITVEIVNTNKATLEAIHKAIGLGVVRPRSGQRLGRKRQFKLVVGGNIAARKFLRLVNPYLITKRRLVNKILA